MQVIPIHIDKEIDHLDDIVQLVTDSTTLRDGDILVITQKIISKQEGRIIKISDVVPSLLAKGIAAQYQKDPRLVEIILSESHRIVRMGRNGVIIVETHTGHICANAGVDESNVKDGYATILPVDPDASAAKIRSQLGKMGMDIVVIISDTFGRPFRMGQTDCAIGVCGIYPILDYTGLSDTFGRILRVSASAIVDEFASAAELVMYKTSGCPAAIIRGYNPNITNDANNINSLLRSYDEDLFR